MPNFIIFSFNWEKQIINFIMMNRSRITAKKTSIRTHRLLERTINPLANSVSFTSANKPVQPNLKQIQTSLHILIHQQPPQEQKQTSFYEKNIFVQSQANVLYQEFLEKVKDCQEKVERQRVNLWTKSSHQILLKIQEQVTEIKRTMRKYEMQLELLYRGDHSLYENMETVRKKTQQKTQIRGALIKFNEEHKKLKSKCEGKEEELSELRRKLDEKLKIKVKFLLILMKQGYFQEDGLKWILVILVSLNYKPKYEDFPSVLDIISRKCLLKEYENIQMQAENAFYQKQKMQAKKAKSYDQLFSQRQPAKLKEVYSDARSYIQEWVKGKKWRRKQYFPLMNHFVSGKKRHNWETEEKRRIKCIMRGEQQKLVWKLMFGIKLQSIF